MIETEASLLPSGAIRIWTWNAFPGCIDLAATNSPAPWKSKLSPSNVVKCGQPSAVAVGGGAEGDPKDGGKDVIVIGTWSSLSPQLEVTEMSSVSSPSLEL